MHRYLITLLTVICCWLTVKAQDTSALLPHLTREDLPNGTLFLPMPPTIDSQAFVNDWLQYRWGMSQRGGERCVIALSDGDRSCANTLRRFSPAIGFNITSENAPLTYSFFERLRKDVTEGTANAKNAFARLRPYQQFHEHTPCPQYEDTIPSSFPSAHAAQGWLYAMVLASFDPQHQEEFYRIGYDFGTSRVILGYHYQSDIEAGRLAASAIFARLLADNSFVEEMNQARTEYQKLKQQYDSRPIVILFDNDVHCNIQGYPLLAGLRDAIQESDSAFVALVSCGDFIQGGTAGTLSKGQYIIDVVNTVGYDAMTLGNHEFDYGTPRLLQLTQQINAPVVCLNFSQKATGHSYFAPAVIRRYGSRQVAFIGVLTPSTIRSEASAFYDADGRQLYDLHPEHLVSMLQATVDSVRSAGADYVILLSHLGEANSDIVASTLIAQTTGIDAVLDGHSHSVIPMDHIANHRGEAVLYSQTGTKFQHIGKLWIPSQNQQEVRMTTELIPTSSLSQVNSRVKAVADSIDAINASLTNRVCGDNAQLLTINDASGHRLVRRGETNLANFCADAYRWFGQSDLALLNGGGVRADLPQGDITYGSLLEVHPFENMLCVISVTGSQLCSVLETACSDYPAENGIFPQPSGFRYSIHPGQTPLICNVEVLDVDGQYHPIEPDREYSLTTIAYLLTQYNGLLQNCEVLKLNIGVDVEALYNYVTDHLHGHIGTQYAAPQQRITIL